VKARVFMGLAPETERVDAPLLDALEGLANSHDYGPIWRAARQNPEPYRRVLASRALPRDRSRGGEIDGVWVLRFATATAETWPGLLAWLDEVCESSHIPALWALTACDLSEAFWNAWREEGAPRGDMFDEWAEACDLPPSVEE